MNIYVIIKINDIKHRGERERERKREGDLMRET